jgi:hypothetical protein
MILSSLDRDIQAVWNLGKSVTISRKNGACANIYVLFSLTGIGSPPKDRSTYSEKSFDYTFPTFGSNGKEEYGK